MPLSQQRPDLVFQGGDPVGGASQHLEPPDVAERNAIDALDDGRVGGQHHVVLILAEKASPFRVEDAEDHEGDIADADRRADAVGRLEEVFRHGLAEHAHLGRGVDVVWREKLAPFHLPVGKRRVTCVDAEHFARRPVLVSCDDLQAVACNWGDAALALGHSASTASTSSDVM